MRLSSCCFRGHNLHPRVTVLYTLSAISFFPSDKFLIFFGLKRITRALLSCNKNVGHHARLREKELLFRCRALLVGNLLRFARARTHLRAYDAKIVRSRDAQCNTEESP